MKLIESIFDFIDDLFGQCAVAVKAGLIFAVVLVVVAVLINLFE